MNYELDNFDMPSYHELQKMGKCERINFFRLFCAYSRYNRLIIHLFMINNAFNDNFTFLVTNLQNQNVLDFEKKVKYIKNSPYYMEFLDVMKEEEEALKKIIDAYNSKLKRI